MTKRIKTFSAIPILVLLIIPLLMPMTQSWSTTATTIASGSNNEIKPQIIADGGGGSIICWLESLGGSTHHVKAQRLNSNGELQWSTSGVTLASSIPYDTANPPMLCTDGAGGAFVVWQYGSVSPYSLYIRRVSSSGALGWAQLEISNADGSHTNFDICSDEAGGVVIVWQDNREGNYNVYAQRIDGNGNKQWGENGTVVIDWTDFQVVPQVIYNGSGGFYVIWTDRRTSEWDMYIQHLNSTGGRLWTTTGVVLCADPAYQSLDDICSDGNGGAIITWTDYRDTDYNIYGQRIAPNGTQFWGTDGKCLVNASGNQLNSELCSDGAEGAFLVWWDKRDDQLGDIYGQHLNSTGHEQWATDGIPIANEVNEQQNFEICSDGAGGIFIVWEDSRSSSNFEIYQQRLNVNGSSSITGNGTLVELQQNEFRPVLACINPGEVVIAGEGDDGVSYNIYAQIYPIRNTDGGIPGFLLVYLLMAIPVLVALYRKKIHF